MNLLNLPGWHILENTTTKHDYRLRAKYDPEAPVVPFDRNRIHIEVSKGKASK